MSCSCGCSGRCGCCEGTRAITPRDLFNRPGLSVLRRRVGDYHDFFETMRSGIAREWIDVDTGEVDAHGRPRRVRTFPLRALHTRAPDDPTIALLDLWAVAADVLSFYTERIAEEGYLRTATELLSVSELARLVGYRRRPGVSASAFLSFAVDDAWTVPVVVPAGARVQSLPGPGEQPVFFETDTPLAAYAAWNSLAPRLHRPMYVPRKQAQSVSTLYFAGTATRLEPNAALLLSYGEERDDQELRFVSAVHEDYDTGRTEVTLRAGKPAEALHALGQPLFRESLDLRRLIGELDRPSRSPAAFARVAVSAPEAFAGGSAAVDDLFARFHPSAAELLTAARARLPVTSDPELQAIYAMRVRAFVYGHTALPRRGAEDVPAADRPDWPYVPDVPAQTARKVIDLDSTYDAIVPGSWVVIVRRGMDAELKKQPPIRQVVVVTRVAQVETVSRTDYDTPATVTRLVLESPWLPGGRRQLRDVRPTVVYAAPESLAPTDELIVDPLCGSVIELDRDVAGLEPGRWVIVSGERVLRSDASGDVTFTRTGVVVSEVAMLAQVRHDVLRLSDDTAVSPFESESDATLPGDRIHTFLQLAAPLASCYVRDTVKVYANVAQATHGTTQSEPLGSGDPAKILQTFDLKSKPLTYVPAPTTSGVQNTLQILVNDVHWHEADDLLDLTPRDRRYATSTDHSEQTRVTFGDGKNGARLPAGIENVRAVYRSGIGKAGNVRAEQLSLLVTRTDGLRGVTNPLRASGGAEPDGIEATRGRAPLAVTALDRLVSTQDYADFALSFAGIAKASAALLPARGGRFVHVTVAGEADAPIDPESELAVDLLAALRRFGDPSLAVEVAERELLALVVAARVRLDADHDWDSTKPILAAALGGCFAFAQRALARDVYAAEALVALQRTPGVDYADLDVFTAVPESAASGDPAVLAAVLTGAAALRQRVAALPARPGTLGKPAAPAQLAVLLESVPATVAITEIPR